MSIREQKEPQNIKELGESEGTEISHLSKQDDFSPLNDRSKTAGEVGLGKK